MSRRRKAAGGRVNLKSKNTIEVTIGPIADGLNIKYGDLNEHRAMQLFACSVEDTNRKWRLYSVKSKGIVRKFHARIH